MYCALPRFEWASAKSGLMRMAAEQAAAAVLEIPWILQRAPQVGVSIRVVRLDAGGGAIGSNGVVKPARGVMRDTEI